MSVVNSNSIYIIIKIEKKDHIFNIFKEQKSK